MSDCHIIAQGEAAEIIHNELIANERQEQKNREEYAQREQAEQEQKIAAQNAAALEAYNYDVAYRVGFDDMARYYLIDTSTKTITEFQSMYINDKATATYSGDLGAGIDFELNGIKMHAETKFDNMILTVKSEYGTSYRGYQFEVDIIKAYGITAEIFDDEIITVDSNEEFNAVMNVKTPADQLVEEFSVKYAGCIVEFDGCVALVMNHEKYKTRYDFLICAGDYDTTPVVGAFFAMLDVNYYDLHLTGSNIPDQVGEKDNLRVRARIGAYSNEGTFIEIDPISIEIR